jgi:hypothetical protein
MAEFSKPKYPGRFNWGDFFFGRADPTMLPEDDPRIRDEEERRRRSTVYESEIGLPSTSLPSNERAVKAILEGANPKSVNLNSTPSLADVLFPPLSPPIVPSNFTPQFGKGGMPTSGQVNRSLLMYPRTSVYGGVQATGPASRAGGPNVAGYGDMPTPVGSSQPKEEDEFGFLDAMFLSNLIAGTQGGPPPTPYGSAFGGGNRSFVGLPFA